jgi:hypothetical protein
MVSLVNDWFHLSRKVTEGDFAKRWHDAAAHEGIITYMMANLRASPTTAAFEILKKRTLEVLEFVGEGDFAKYLEKMYLTAPWDAWHAGATPAGVGASGQQVCVCWSAVAFIIFIIKLNAALELNAALNRGSRAATKDKKR